MSSLPAKSFAMVQTGDRILEPCRHDSLGLVGIIKAGLSSNNTDTKLSTSIKEIDLAGRIASLSLDRNWQGINVKNSDEVNRVDLN